MSRQARFSAAFLAALLSCADAWARLPEQAHAALRAAGIPEDAMGVLVQRVSDGKVVLEHYPTVPRQPASTMKLLTSIVALDTLGPAHRGRTQVLAAGDVSRGVLTGDLVLRGMGNVDFDWRAFERALVQVRQRGVTEIRGDLVLDLGYFRPRRTDIGLGPFDEAPEFRYNVIPDALLLNTNLLQVDLIAEADGVRVEVMPRLDRVEFVSELTLVERRCQDWEDGWKVPVVERAAKGVLRVKLHGNFPRDCIATTSLNVIERTAYVDRLFRALWRGMGGRFRGRVREGDTPATARLLVEHRSRALSDIVRDVNKRSDNPITRVVYLTLGANGSTAPDETSARAADALVRGWMQSRGIDPVGLVLENGSGLSRAERVSPLQLGGVLRAALASEWAPEFVSSLPIAAVDGSMRNRLKNSAAAGRGRIKTGTLRDATGVAGYVKDASGENHVVVALIDHPLAKRDVARPIVDAVIDWVARGAPEAALARAP